MQDELFGRIRNMMLFEGITIEELFLWFDDTGRATRSGRITSAQFINGIGVLANRLGIVLTEAEVWQILVSMDNNGSGSINMYDWTRKLFPRRGYSRR